MAWTKPKIWRSSQTTSAAEMNAEIRDNEKYLYDRIQSGTVSIVPSGANVPTSTTVMFPVPFTSIPYVVVSAASGSVGTQVKGVGADTETTTSVRITVTRSNTTSTAIRWIAYLP